MQRNYPAALVVLNPVSGTTTGDVPLNSINTDKLPDGCQVLVLSTNKVYELRKTSIAVQSLPDIVAPIAGPGAWFELANGATFFQALDVSHAAIPPQSSVDSASPTINGLASAADIVVFNLTDTGLPTGVSIGPVRVTGTGAALFRFVNVTAATVAAATVSLEVAVLPGG